MDNNISFMLKSYFQLTVARSTDCRKQLLDSNPYLVSSCLVAVRCTDRGSASMPVLYVFPSRSFALVRYDSHSQTPSSLNWTSRWGSSWLTFSHPSRSCFPKLRLSWAVLHPRYQIHLLIWAWLIVFGEPLGYGFGPCGPMLPRWCA